MSLVFTKELLDWQKKQVEQLKNYLILTMFIIAKNYDLNDEDELEDDTEDYDDSRVR